MDGPVGIKTVHQEVGFIIEDRDQARECGICMGIGTRGLNNAGIAPLHIFQHTVSP